MKLKTSFRLWTLSSSLSTLTFGIELVNSYLSVSAWYRMVFFVVVGVVMVISFVKSIRSYKHIMSMRLIGRAIRKKAIASNNTYELKMFNNFEALSRALQLDKDTYDDEHTWTIYRWAEFYAKNKRIAFGLFYADDYEQQNCLGGLSCFPIRKDVFLSLKKGEMSEMDITADDILNEDEMNSANYWLIPGVVIFSTQAGTVKSSIILTSFLTWLVENTRFPLSFIAFGYSNQGRSILNKFGFTKFKHAGEDEMSVYTNTISSLDEMLLKVPDLLKR